MLKKNQTAEVLIENTTPEGYGVCRLDGRAVFVSSALPGERWEILILKVTNTAVWAKGLKLLVPSPSRKKIDCPNLCGGCTLRFMDGKTELAIKKSYVDECLRRIGGEMTETSAIHPSPKEERYRNKAIFAVDLVEGKTAFGFYRARTHTLVPITDCMLQSTECLQTVRTVTAFMNENGVPPYNEQTGKGTVRHLFWRESRCGDRVLCIVTARGFGGLTGSLTERLCTECPFLTGIVLNINKSKGNVVLSDEFYVLWGDSVVRESLCGNRFEIAPRAFLQINPPQAENLYSKAMEYAADGRLCLELYCGAGTISLALAKHFEHVIGAEIVPEAVTNAKSNAKKNGIENAEFFCADASEIAEKLRADGLSPDVVVVDPPRKGLEENVVKSIADMSPLRVVYISCNPATLARDIKRFAACNYKLNEAEAFDMFPRTAHVETVCLLTHS